MMNKRITAAKSPARIVSTPKGRFNFPPGCKYLSGGTQYTVRRTYGDTTVEQRLIYSERNGEEVVLLSHLLAEAEAPGFSVVYSPEDKPKTEEKTDDKPQPEVEDAGKKGRTTKER